MKIIIILIISSITIHAFYKYGIRMFGNLSRYFDLFASNDQINRLEGEKMTRLVFASFSQAMFLLFLTIITSVIPSFISDIKELTISMILKGILLGIGEMAAAGLFAKLILHLLFNLSKKNNFEHEGSWMDEGKGGWMLEYRKLVELTPFYIFIDAGKSSRHIIIWIKA